MPSTTPCAFFLFFVLQKRQRRAKKRKGLTWRTLPLEGLVPQLTGLLHIPNPFDKARQRCIIILTWVNFSRSAHHQMCAQIRFTIPASDQWILHESKRQSPYPSLPYHRPSLRSRRQHVSRSRLSNIITCTPLSLSLFTYQNKHNQQWQILKTRGKPQQRRNRLIS